MWGATGSQSRPAEVGVPTGELETAAVRGPPYVRCFYGGERTHLHTNQWPPAQPSPRTLSPLPWGGGLVSGAAGPAGGDY